MAAVLIGIAWFGPSRDYLYVPNKATPVASKVTVEGEKVHAPGPGALYYVDVSIRRATWAERALRVRCARRARRSCPRAEVVPPGSSFEARHEDGLREMARSEKVAAAVALKQAGFKVKTTNKGALVEAVASDAPAATKLDSGDVIVTARGKPILTPGELRAAFTGVHPGDDVVLRLRRDGQLRTVTVRTVESPSEKGRAIVGIRVAQAADIKLPVKVDINLGQVGGPSAGLPFALDVLQELGTERRPGPQGRRDRRDRARRLGRPDRRREAEDVRRTQGRRGRLPRAGWGKRSRGTPLCREPSHHPGREFSTGVVRLAYASLEIVNLQDVRRGGQQTLIAGLSCSLPLHRGDMVATMPPVPRSHYRFTRNILHAS